MSVRECLKAGTFEIAPYAGIVQKSTTKKYHLLLICGMCQKSLLAIIVRLSIRSDCATNIETKVLLHTS